MSADIPAWGTPDGGAPAPARTTYLVVGFYEATSERFADRVDAASPQAAEDDVIARFRGQTGEADDGETVSLGLTIVGVVAVEDGLPIEVSRKTHAWMEP